MGSAQWLLRTLSVDRLSQYAPIQWYAISLLAQSWASDIAGKLCITVGVHNCKERLAVLGGAATSTTCQ